MNWAHTDQLRLIRQLRQMRTILSRHTRNLSGSTTARVVAFAPSLVAVEAEDGGLNAYGFPMTSCYVEEMPAEITNPVVIAVCGLAGEEYHAVR